MSASDENTPKHWTHFLPEAGSIVLKGDRLIEAMRLVTRLEGELQRAEQAMNSLEAEIRALAQGEWTPDEIRQAQMESERRLKLPARVRPGRAR